MKLEGRFRVRMMCKMDRYEAVKSEEEPAMGERHWTIGICLSRNE